MTSSLLVRDTTVGRRTGVDVRVRDGVVVEVGIALRRDGEHVLDAAGGTLLPGLHDHHVHLHAVAAALASVSCAPPAVASAHHLAAVLRQAAAAGLPVRGSGYHESVAGNLDRDRLDAWVPAVPVRVQHRSGAAWFLNTAALRAFDLEGSDAPAVERDEHGRATGRILRGDQLLRNPTAALPDLTGVGEQLSRYGVTGVTDATPELDSRALRSLRTAHEQGCFPQRIRLLGAPLGDLGTDVGPFKVLLDESSGLELPSLVQLAADCQTSHRALALHAVTAAEAVVAVAALQSVAPQSGHRLEHGGILPPSLDTDLVRLGITVVTQPHFIYERGDAYLSDVDPRDTALLYRCRSLLVAGVPVAAGTDAPYGHLDPWRAIAAAMSRKTRAGTALGTAERLRATKALGLFLGPLDDPGGPPRRVATGGPADFCLFGAPLDVVLRQPSADWVRATVVAGRVVFDRRDA